MNKTLVVLEIDGGPRNLEEAREWLNRHYIESSCLVGIEMPDSGKTEQNPRVQADNGTRHEEGRPITDTVRRLDGNGNNANSRQDHATFCVGHDEMGCITERRPI